jgi:hypothetical protein
MNNDDTLNNDRFVSLVVDVKHQISRYLERRRRKKEIAKRDENKT